MKNRYKIITFLLVLLSGFGLTATSQPAMMFGDTTRVGRPYSKDPHVVCLGNRYLMYYSIPPFEKPSDIEGWGIGIAESRDLTNWEKVGEITPLDDYEAKGLCAPGALVRNDTVHLFYQTYGNGRNDAICHAWSADGIHFVRNNTNPVFKPDGDWNCGRAIDAEVFLFGGRYFLYYATRDQAYQVQQIGVAAAPAGTSFDRNNWTNISVEAPILKPELPWEKNCIEASSVVEMDGRLYMFYAGGYNNEPQQVGVACSDDGVKWERLSTEPFLPNGDAGTWNSSESGHPHIFKDTDGQTFLFYQGNNDKGYTWLISQTFVGWKDGKPYHIKEKQRKSLFQSIE